MQGEVLRACESVEDAVRERERLTTQHPDQRFYVLFGVGDAPSNWLVVRVLRGVAYDVPSATIGLEPLQSGLLFERRRRSRDADDDR
jgi:hypothetical protein